MSAAILLATGDAFIVWEWKIDDHLIQDIDSSLDNYGIISITNTKHASQVIHSSNNARLATFLGP